MVLSLSHGAHCTFEITLSQAITLTLMLVCAFFSTQVQKYLAWVCNMVSLPGDCHASYASLLTSQLSQATNACLMLSYSFSPRVHSIPRGPRIFARNDIVLRTERNRFSLRAINDVITYALYAIFRATHLCHSEEQSDVRISRKGLRIQKS